MRRAAGSLLGLALVTMGCTVHAPAKRPFVSDGPAPRASAAAAQRPPARAMVPPGDAAEAARALARVDSLAAQPVSVSARQADLRRVLVSLAEELGVGLVMDRDVGGRVTLELNGVPAAEAFDALLTPAGYAYRLDPRLLHVHGAELVTRIFTVDYITSVRRGRSRLSASSGGSSGEGANSSGGENLMEIDSEVASDLWDEMIAGLELIVFGGAASGSAEVAGEPAGLAGALGFPEGDAGGGPGDTSGGDGGRREATPRLVVHPHAGVVLVTATFATLNRVGHFLERIQGASLRQVVIEARIVEVTLSDDFTLGIDWSRIPGAGLDVRSVFGADDVAAAQALSPETGAFQVAFSEGDFDVLLDALATQGHVEMLSAPRVAVMNNQKAIFKAAREESFFSQRIDYETQPDGSSEPILSVEPQRVTIGLVLDVTPQISDAGDIMMNIHPSITELVGEDVFPPGASGADILANAPILDIREVDTVVRVPSQGLLVIGGLMKERVSETVKMVPFLGKIPVLGHLFRQTAYATERVELVIVLRPWIIVGQEATQQALRTLDRLGGAVDP